MDFIKKHIEILSLLTLLVVCYFLFFFKMGHYPLIDVDETRYVSIARDMLNVNDWMTLKLNNEFFFEKPPLYFWLVNLSFLIFNQISEAVARLPIAICATIGTFLMYIVGKKAISRRFGMISALILATSFEFLVLSRIAILDMLLSMCILFSTLLGFMTFFCEEKTKKYFWWGFYVFSALAVLAKGIPGFVIPFGTLFISYLISGKIKEIFKPVYLLPGFVLFFLITLPWHIAMFQLHGDLFFKEYVVKHHLARFMGSQELGRIEPWFFFIPVFLVGFLPWTASFISMFVDTTKKFFIDAKNYFSGAKFTLIEQKWNELTNPRKFLTLNTIFFAFTFLFFSSASTKLPTYILPAVAPAAFLLGYYWYEYIYEAKHNSKILISTIITNSIFIIAAIAAIFTPFFLDSELMSDISPFRIPVILLFFVVPTLGIFAAIVKQRILVFASNIALMVGIMIICASFIFNFMCTFGENDLIEFAIKAKNEKVKLATYDFGRRYSAIYYYEGIVDFQTENDIKWLKEYTTKNPKAYVVVKLKNMGDLDKNFKYQTIDTGRKYCLIRKK